MVNFCLSQRKLFVAVGKIMPNFKIKRKSWAKLSKWNDDVALNNAALRSFSTEVLGLGDINSPSHPTDSIAAVFDLAGFTNFCNQIDPQLSVPNYLSTFLSWLMEQIKDVAIREDIGGYSILWNPLPYFVKFTGDGLLVLWNCENMKPVQMRNIIINIYKICYRYRSKFFSEISNVVVAPPRSLRCGIARGMVFSVGNGSDYVGSCINMAARIQKLPGLSFAFNRRGFDLEQKGVGKFFKKRIVIKKVSIRGISQSELVGVLSEDILLMSKEDATLYKNP